MNPSKKSHVRYGQMAPQHRDLKVRALNIAKCLHLGCNLPLLVSQIAFIEPFITGLFHFLRNNLLYEIKYCKQCRLNIAIQHNVLRNSTLC